MNFSRTALPYQWLMIFNLAMRVCRIHTIFSVQKSINLHSTSMCLFWVVHVRCCCLRFSIRFFFSVRRGDHLSVDGFIIFGVHCSMCHVVICSVAIKWKKTWRCSIENMLVLLAMGQMLSMKFADESLVYLCPWHYIIHNNLLNSNFFRRALSLSRFRLSRLSSLAFQVSAR